jgi:hypothetical protein
MRGRFPETEPGRISYVSIRTDETIAYATIVSMMI